MATRGHKTHSSNYADPCILQTYFIYIVNFLLKCHVFALSFMSSLSYDTLSLAVDIEHEVFKASKSSNLYKAAVLKRVTSGCSACHRIICSLTGIGKVGKIYP